MAIVNREVLKFYFKKGSYPKEENFYDWIDSFCHKEEDEIALNKVKDLPQVLNDKYSLAAGTELEQNHRQLTEDFALHERSNIEEFKTFYRDISTIREIFKEGDILETTQAAFVALGGRYKNLYALASYLKTFLEGVSEEIVLTKLILDIAAAEVTKEADRAKAAEGEISRELEEERNRAEHTETTLGERVTTVQTELRQADSAMRLDITGLRAAIAELQVAYGQPVNPLDIRITFPKTITLNNPVKQYIKAELLPAYCLQDVLFLGDNQAVAVEPDGGLTVLGLGKSRIHVIPTRNTAIYKTIEIEVVEPAFMEISSTALLLTGDGELLLT